MLQFNTELGKAYNADCFDVMRMLPDNSVDMILADLPYGTTACKWDTVIPFEPMWKEFHRIAKPNAAIVLTASQPFTSALVMSNVKNFKHAWVWNKVRGTNFALTKYQPMKEHEDVCIFSNGGGKVIYYPQMEERKGGGKSLIGKSIQSNTKGGKDSVTVLPPGKHKIVSELRVPSSIQTFTGVKQGSVHPTQKPVALFEYLIKTYTNESEVVFDPTAGSLTTGVAAENLNRHWICIEKLEEYFNKGIERFKP